MSVAVAVVVLALPAAPRAFTGGGVDLVVEDGWYADVTADALVLTSTENGGTVTLRNLPAHPTLDAVVALFGAVVDGPRRDSGRAVPVVAGCARGIVAVRGSIAAAALVHGTRHDARFETAALAILGRAKLSAPAAGEAAYCCVDAPVPIDGVVDRDEHVDAVAVDDRVDAVIEAGALVDRAGGVWAFAEPPRVVDGLTWYSLEGIRRGNDARAVVVTVPSPLSRAHQPMRTAVDVVAYAQSDARARALAAGAVAALRATDAARPDPAGAVRALDAAPLVHSDDAD